jgi:hypothetical protein
MDPLDDYGLGDFLSDTEEEYTEAVSIAANGRWITQDGEEIDED